MSETKQPILITGITGFIASQTALTFLTNNYPIIGTLRSPSQIPPFTTHPIFAPYVSSGQLCFKVVKDIATSDLKEVMSCCCRDDDGKNEGKDDDGRVLLGLESGMGLGLETVIHTAGKIDLEGKSWEEYRKAIVDGTKNVLEAAKKVSSIKTVIIMSSFLATINPTIPADQQADITYTEENLNPLTGEMVSGMNVVSMPFAPALWYATAKKEAMILAEEMVKECSFKLSIILPPPVFGPPIQPLPTIGSLNMTINYIYAFMLPLSLGGGRLMEAALPAFVDVRDVAESCLKVVEKGEGGEGRWLISAGSFSGQEIVNIIREDFPALHDRVPMGHPKETDPRVYTIDNSKSKKELGMNYIPLRKCIGDTVRRLLELEKELGV